MSFVLNISVGESRPLAVVSYKREIHTAESIHEHVICGNDGAVNN